MVKLVTRDRLLLEILETVREWNVVKVDENK
jgi:hypothetical protein